MLGGQVYGVVPGEVLEGRHTGKRSGLWQPLRTVRSPTALPSPSCRAALPAGLTCPRALSQLSRDGDTAFIPEHLSIGSRYHFPMRKPRLQDIQ